MPAPLVAKEADFRVRPLSSFDLSLSCSAVSG